MSFPAQQACVDMQLSCGKCGEQSCMPGSGGTYGNCGNSANFVNNGSTCAGNAGNSGWQWGNGAVAEGCNFGMAGASPAACSSGDAKVHNPVLNAEGSWPAGCTNAAWGNAAFAGTGKSMFTKCYFCCSRRSLELLSDLS